MFDHAQDHVPAMVLIEAARQLATAACLESGGGDAGLVALSSEFHRYVEFDAPAHLRGVTRPTRETRERHGAELIDIDVEVEQFDQSSATVHLTFDAFPAQA